MAVCAMMTGNIIEARIGGMDDNRKPAPLTLPYQYSTWLPAPLSMKIKNNRTLKGDLGTIWSV